MSKLTVSFIVTLIGLSAICYALYMHGESLAKDLATQTANVELLVSSQKDIDEDMRKCLTPEIS